MALARSLWVGGRVDARALAVIVCGCLLAAGCGNGEKPEEADEGDAVAADAGTSDSGGAVSDSGGGVTDVGGGGASDTVADSGPEVSLPDGALEPGLLGAFEQLSVPGGVNTAWHACWTEGSTRAYLAGTGGSVVGWNGSAWTLLTQGSFQTLHGVAATSGGLYAHAVGIGGTLAQGKQPPKGLAGVWGSPGGCQSTEQCGDGDTCTADWCDNGTCRHTASGAVGCCGSKPWQDAFTNLAGWTVKDLYEGSADKGGVLWSTAALVDAVGKPLATSPPKALYFGLASAPCADDPTKVCPSFDNGKVVGATALSQVFTLPPSTKTEDVTLTFQLRMQAENGVGFDALTVKVVEGSKKTEVWSKAAIGGSGDTEGAFVLQSVDLSAFSGKAIQLELAFDSKDASLNNGLGVLIDDLVVSTSCKAGETAGKGMTEATFFDVWAADDQNAWAVGTEGSIAKWDGKQWQMQTGTTAPRDTLAMAGLPGGLQLGVGHKGKASTLSPTGLGALDVGTALDLVDVDVDPAPAAGAPEAIAITSSSVAYEYDGTTWKMVSVGGFGLAAVAALGNGVWAAVAGNGIYERGVDGAWKKTTSLQAVLRDVARVDASKAFAVGLGGTVVTRTGGVWQETVGALGLNNVNAVSASPDGAVWAAGENGLVARFVGGAWKGEKTPTGKHLTDVWSGGDDLAWIVGLAGTILRYNGGKFEALTSPFEGVDWLAVWGSDPNDVYLSAKGGLVVRWNGVNFQVLESPVVGTLRAVHGFSAQDVWAVGSKGGIFHSAGGGWTQVPIEPFQVPEQPDYLVESDLFAIWGAAPNDIWAAGAPDSQGDGVLVHYDGKAWRYSQALKDETRTIRAIWGWSPSRLLFAGTQGMVLAFDGKDFTALDSGSITTFYDVCGWGKDALLVGGIGTVLRYLPPAPPAATDGDATP